MITHPDIRERHVAANRGTSSTCVASCSKREGVYIHIGRARYKPLDMLVLIEEASLDVTFTGVSASAHSNFGVHVRKSIQK